MNDIIMNQWILGAQWNYDILDDTMKQNEVIDDIIMKKINLDDIIVNQWNK